MKLLFDENLSPRLPRLLSDLYPDSAHVVALGIDRTGDSRIWNYAKDFDFIITTKDSDYLELSESRGHPPKLVLVESGNQPTWVVEADLRNNYDRMRRFSGNDEPVLRI